MTCNHHSTGKEKGCDTSYRAEDLSSHPTHPCGTVFRQFRDVPCARSALSVRESREKAAISKRANGALAEALR